MKHFRLLSAALAAMVSIGAFGGEIDQTSKVLTDAGSWGGGFTATTYSPAVTTADGRTVQMEENYNGSTCGQLGVLLHQTVSGLVNGTYKVVLYANAMCTGNRDTGLEERVTEADDLTGRTFVYAAVGEDTLFANVPVKIATESVTDGNGEFTIENINVTDGTLDLGLVKKLAGSNWNNIQIKSLTLITSDEDAYATALATAQSLLESGQAMSADAEIALQNAIDANQDAQDKAAAADALNAAIQQANASIIAYGNAKAALDAMLDVMNGTNVYTEEAYNAYKAIYDEKLAAYTDGSMTDDEANALENPEKLMGWHADNAVDDFLLSAWGTKGYDSDLYINVWSTEGETDGSNFKVPFFEYWTWDANALTATTKTATVTVPAGKYLVSALVRVRAQNDYTAPVTGITLQVNDGEPVDVTAGQQVEGTPFFLGTFTAQGEVGEDGLLNIKFNVAEGNNISWLSFKNVQYMAFQTASNLDFSQGTPLDNGVCTYDYDMEKNGTTYSQMQPVEGWEMGVENGNARAGGMFQYGSSAWLGGPGFVPPAADAQGNSEENALGIVAVWTGTVQYTAPATLEAGNYKLTIPVYNAGGTVAPVKSLIGFVTEDGTEYLTAAKVYEAGAWTTEIINFTLDKTTNGYFTLGYTSPNSGSSANQHLFIDEIKVETVPDEDLLRVKLETLINDANTALEDDDNVGTNLFQTSEEAYNAFADAVAQAQNVYDNATATADEIEAAIESLQAAIAAYANAAVNEPVEGGQYTFKQRATDLYLALNPAETVDAGNADAVALSATPYPFNLVKTDGGWWMTDTLADHQNYVGAAGTNGWTMSATAENRVVCNFTRLSDGYYTINMTGYNCIGTDDAQAGAQAWADKYMNRSGYDNTMCQWEIAEYVAPLPDAISDITKDATEGSAKGGVYTIGGQLVRSNASLSGLRKGVYVVDGRKVVVR